MKVYLETEDVDLGYHVTAVYKCLEDIPYPIEQLKKYKSVWKQGRATVDMEEDGFMEGQWVSVERYRYRPLYTIYEYEVE